MIQFNEKMIPSFVIVNKVTHSVLPSISQKTMKVNGRAGEIDFGNEIGSRVIEVELTIVGSNLTDLRGKVRQLASWLYYAEPKELIFTEESDKYYLAKFTGDSDLEEMLRVGQGAIQFYCSDPHAYSTNVKTVELDTPLPENPAIIDNNGGANTYPKMEYTFTQATTEFNIISDTKFMRFGKPSTVDKTPVNAKPLVLSDDMSSLTGWTSATLVDNGVINGSFTTNGYSFKLAEQGEGSKWHGASAVKAFSKPVQDFELHTRIGMKSVNANELGRVELYLLTENGTQLGKISLSDSNPNGRTPFAQVRLKNKYVLESYGDYAGVWKDWNDGYMNIHRVGKKWAFYYSILEDGKEHTRLYREWYDGDGAYMDKVASIQIHIGNYGANPTIYQMYIGDIKVWERNGVTVADNQSPYIFQSGDVLSIDSETDMILLNGMPYYTTLDPSSQFITLEQGTNGIITSPHGVATGTLSFQERWL
jgi:predicted phage tail component-like protein